MCQPATTVLFDLIDQGLGISYPRDRGICNLLEVSKGYFNASRIFHGISPSVGVIIMNALPIIPNELLPTRISTADGKPPRIRVIPIGVQDRVMPRKSSQSGGVGPRPEVVRTGFGIVLSPGIRVSRHRGGGEDGEGGGVQGDEIAVGSVGVALDNGAGLVGKGGSAELLVVVGVKLLATGHSADQFVDVRTPHVFGGRRGGSCAGGVVGEDLFAGVGEDSVAG